jgi:hypothetical protein
MQRWNVAWLHRLIDLNALRTLALMDPDSRSATDR